MSPEYVRIFQREHRKNQDSVPMHEIDIQLKELFIYLFVNINGKW